MSPSKAGVTMLKVLKAVVWIVYALASAASIILLFGFFLLLFDANIEAGFAQFIYTWSIRFAGPFVNMIEPLELEGGGIVSWSALVAVAAYAVLAALVGGVLNSISRRISRDTSRRAVGQTTVTTTSQVGDGTVVSTAATRPIIEPSAVERAEAEKRAAAEAATAQPDVAAQPGPSEPEPPAS